MDICLLRKDFFDRPETLGLSCDYRTLLAGCTVNPFRKASGVTFFSPSVAAALGFSDFAAVTKGLKIMDDEGLVHFDDKTFEVLPGDHHLVNDLGVGSHYGRRGGEGVELIKSDRIRTARKEMQDGQPDKLQAWSVASPLLSSLAARGLMVSDLAIALCLYCNPTLSRARTGLLNVAMFAGMTAQTQDAAVRGIKNVEKLGLVKIDWRTGEYMCQKWPASPRGLTADEVAGIGADLSSKALKKGLAKLAAVHLKTNSQKLFSEMSLKSSGCCVLDFTQPNPTKLNSTQLNCTERSRPAGAAQAASKSDGGRGDVAFSTDEKQKAKTALTAGGWSLEEAEVAVNTIVKNASTKKAAEAAIAYIAATEVHKITSREGFWLSTIKKANEGLLAPPRQSKHYNLGVSASNPVDMVMNKISGVTVKQNSEIQQALEESAESFCTTYQNVLGKQPSEELVALAQNVHKQEEAAA